MIIKYYQKKHMISYLIKNFLLYNIMIIYIIRHEDRTQDATMFSPLTESGLKNSNNLIKVIDDLNINFIYSSPYIRTYKQFIHFLKK